MGEFKKSWATATKKAKCEGKLFHDLRRTCTRRLLAAGVPQVIARELTWHRTSAMFDRYAIVSSADVIAAQTKVAEFRKTGVDSRRKKDGVTAKFSVGDRVIVSRDFFWAKGATGTISKPPQEVTALSGPWEEGLTWQEVSALGTNTVYWIWFDEPQFDADGDGPYRGGQIWESALTFLARDKN